MKYFVLFLILAGFVGTVFADNTPNDPDFTPELYCNHPICLIEDENFKEPIQGSDFVIKVQVEPETKFTARIFDTKYELTYIESVFANRDGIARIAYPIPHDAKDGHYEVTLTSYTSNGAVHSGLLLQIGDRFASHDETEFTIHAHMYRHDDDHFKPIVINEPINIGISTNYKFVNDTSIPFEFTIFDPNGKIIDKGTIVNEKGKTVRHPFVTETDGMHMILVKSNIDGIAERSEKFGVLKSKYVIHEKDRDYQVLVRPMDEPTVAINNMEFDKDARQITFELESTWYFRDMLIVELPYGFLNGPYDVFVNGQMQCMDSEHGCQNRIFQRGDFTTLSIPLEYNSTKVQIIGTTVFPKVTQELTANSRVLEYNAEETLTIHGTSIPEENLTVKVYKSDGSVAFSEEFMSGPYGTFEHDVFAWPKHSLDFPDGRYTVEISSAENQERLQTINIKFQNRYDFFSGFQQIPLQHQLKNFEFLPTKLACKEGMTLVVKEHDDSPACVFSATAAKLSQRGGWTIIEHRIHVEWLDSDYTVSGTGIVQVVDSRMNMSAETVESLDVDVWSDSDPDGIELRLTETGPNTDTFEETVYFSETVELSEDRLFVSAGDLVQVFHKNIVDGVLVTRN